MQEYQKKSLDSSMNTKSSWIEVSENSPMNG
jgi:hypothetical protein